MTREEIKTELEEYWGTVFDSLLLDEFIVRVSNRNEHPLSEYNEWELSADFEYVLNQMSQESWEAKDDIF
jgi:hypothetical protein